MRVDVTEHDNGTRTLTLDILQKISIGDLTDHDLDDIAFVLAQRKAMSRRCPQATGEHTCSLDPRHDGDHLCRACTRTWKAVP